VCRGSRGGRKIVAPDQFGEERLAQARRGAKFLLCDHLQEHATGDVAATALLDDARPGMGGNQSAHVFNGDIAAELGVVQDADSGIS